MAVDRREGVSFVEETPPVFRLPILNTLQFGDFL